MKSIDVKSRRYDLMIVALFLVSFLCLLSKVFLWGTLLVLIGWYLVYRQEKVLKAETDIAEIHYAGFWVRTGSLLVDMAVFGLWESLLFLIFGKCIYEFLPFALFGVTYLLVFLFMLRKWGQTPGKMLMGVKVVKSDFTEITWKQVLLRQTLDIVFNVWYLIKALLFLAGIITGGMILVGSKDPAVFPANIFKIFSDKLLPLYFLWIFSELIILLTNRKKRALHDYLAGTVVIVKKKASWPWPLWLLAALLINVGYFWYFYGKHDFLTEVWAEKGDPIFQDILGEDYYLGRRGYPKDYALAFQWYEKAALQGNLDAEFYLGEMYEHGLGVPVNKKEAIQCYTRALNCELIKFKAEEGLKRLGVKSQ